MASIYNLEPQPTAKLVLQTTAGDVSLELFAKQIPLASRNFIQHCLDGYYTGSIFHRLVPGFIIQGGDPTGTGSGGISAINDGEPFQDEFHSRLKFNRRGLLGMANESTENSNGSQFFFTLAATPELQGKNTLFGRIEGDTIYNLMKMAEGELVEGTEKPIYPTKITGAEVLVNPFEDVVARVREAPRVKDEVSKKDVKKRKKPTTGKNVLSFGGDEDGDEEMAAPVLKKTKANPKLVSAGIEKPEKMTALPEAPREKKPEKARRRKTPSPSPDSEVEQSPPKKSGPPQEPNEDEPTPPSSPEPEQMTKTTSALEKTNAEIAALKASMKRNVDVAPKQKEKPKNALEAMIPATSTRGRKRGKVADEKGALDIFKAFKQRLEDMPVASAAAPPIPTTTETPTNGDISNPEPTTAEGAEDEEADLCDLHFIANCQSCKSWSDQNTKPDAEAEMDGEDDAAWMSHRLNFAKDTLGKDLEWKRKMEEIEIIDPREKARSIKEERKRERDKGKKK